MSAGDSPSTRAPGLTRPFQVYVGLVAAGVLAIVPAGVLHAAATPLESVLWVAFISAASLLAIPMVRGLTVDVNVSAPVIIAAAVIFDPALAVLLTALSLAGERELRADRPWWLIVFNRSQLALAAGAASVAGAAVGVHVLAETLAAVVVYNIVNTAAIAIGLWLQGRAGLRQATRQAAIPFPRFAVDFGVVMLMAVLIVVAYDQAGLWALPLLGLPMWLGYSALRSAREAEDRAEQLAARVADLEILNSLGADLLTVRDAAQVPGKGQEALRSALAIPEVEVTLDGQQSAPLDGDGRDEHLRTVPILGAEPAAVRVPHGLSDSAMAVVEAVAGLLGMALQRVELEAELSEVERARAALSGRILEEGTRERSRIALEIHDEVLPYLAAAGIQADNVRSALVMGDEAHVDRLADATRGAVHDGIARLREVLDALQRQIVVPGGLQPALVEALEELRLKHGVEGRLRADDPLPPLPLAVEILLLETVRGCLANVALHAQAESVTVSLTTTERHIVAEVRDDGRGFDPGAVEAGHHGLALMAQRVELARGRFSVESRPGAGTTVKVEVPV